MLTDDVKFVLQGPFADPRSDFTISPVWSFLWFPRNGRRRGVGHGSQQSEHIAMEASPWRRRGGKVGFQFDDVRKLVPTDIQTKPSTVPISRHRNGKIGNDPMAHLCLDGAGMRKSIRIRQDERIGSIGRLRDIHVNIRRVLYVLGLQVIAQNDGFLLFGIVRLQ